VIAFDPLLEPFFDTFDCNLQALHVLIGQTLSGLVLRLLLRLQLQDHHLPLQLQLVRPFDCFLRCSSHRLLLSNLQISHRLLVLLLCFLLLKLEQGSLAISLNLDFVLVPIVLLLPFHCSSSLFYG